MSFDYEKIELLEMFIKLMNKQKSLYGWKFSEDDGICNWTKGKLSVDATPFWDGEDGIAVSVYVNDKQIWSGVTAKNSLKFYGGKSATDLNATYNIKSMIGEMKLALKLIERKFKNKLK